MSRSSAPAARRAGKLNASLRETFLARGRLQRDRPGRRSAHGSPAVLRELEGRLRHQCWGLLRSAGGQARVKPSRIHTCWSRTHRAAGRLSAPRPTCAGLSGNNSLCRGACSAKSAQTDPCWLSQHRKGRAVNSSIASLEVFSSRLIGGGFGRLWRGATATPTTRHSRAGPRGRVGLRAAQRCRQSAPAIETDFKCQFASITITWGLGRSRARRCRDANARRPGRGFRANLHHVGAQGRSPYQARGRRDGQPDRFRARSRWARRVIGPHGTAASAA